MSKPASKRARRSSMEAKVVRAMGDAPIEMVRKVLRLLRAERRKAAKRGAAMAEWCIETRVSPGHAGPRVERAILGDE